MILAVPLAHAAAGLRRIAVTTAVASAVGLALAGVLVVPVHAAAPMVKSQAPGYYRLMLGDIEVTAISDGTVDLPVDKLLHEPAGATKAALVRAHLTPPVETSVNAFLVNTGARLVLIDSGAGTLFGPTLGKLIANIEAAGYKADQVDDIVITHMHPDHVGGLAANGAPVFANATVHADRRDAEFWLDPAHLDKAPADAKGFYQGAMASLKPYQAAGRFKAFDGGGEITPGVRAESAYGHTPGHTVYVVQSMGRKLVLIGDLIHVAAVQLDRPGVTLQFDTDVKRAAAARQKVFAQAAKEGALVGAAHLQFPGIGFLRRAGTGYQWQPVNYTTQFK